MTPRDRKHVLLLAILVATFVLLLRDARADLFGPEYSWQVDGPASETYQWVVVPPDDSIIDVILGRNPLTLWRACLRSRYTAIGGCAYHLRKHCTVYSYVSEADARVKPSADGLTLFQHEVGEGYGGVVLPTIGGKKYGHCAGFGHSGGLTE